MSNWKPRQHIEEITIAEHGFVRLMNVFGSDDLIAEAARVNREPQNGATTEGLLRYMMRKRHTSPFEFANLIFHVSLPIFVARQWMRHRMCSFSEWSARYGVLPDNYWTPEKWRGQSEKNHQGSEGVVDYEPDDSYGSDNDQHLTIGPAEEVALYEYKRRLDAGVAREQARSCLPLSIYTQFYWKIDLHNLMHFIDLRDDGHAQPEIVDYAQAITAIVNPRFPICMAAWKDYRKDAITFTGPELRALRGERFSMTDGEYIDFAAKVRKSGLDINTPAKQ